VSIDTDLTVSIPFSSRYQVELISKDFDNALLHLPPSPGTAPGTAADNGYGLAVDLGTTTIGLSLCALDPPRILASAAIRNPQVMVGLDVISRICAVQTRPGSLHLQQRLAVSAIEQVARQLLRAAAIPVNRVSSLVVVGNPTMIHLLLGEDPTSLGQAPYTPAFTEARSLPARQLGFSFPASTTIHCPGLLSGFLGSDILASALAVDLAGYPEGTLLIDMGTNGELLLKGKTGFFATSCATGPAFEGSNLTCGMPAMSGAIENISLRDHGRTIETSVITREGRTTSPEGICGSGVISAVAAFLKEKIILPSGAFSPACRLPALRRDRRPTEFVIVPGEDSGLQRSLVITQTDIRAIQLAKGALSSGIDMLCRQAGINRPHKILVAGAMGSHLSISDCMMLGLFGPPTPAEAITAVGNTAGLGAIRLLIDQGAATELIRLSNATTIKNVSDWEGFQSSFVRAMSFP
ncbi:MAG: DUF4445 domain-containing protein, partial [Desulfofustis sp.]|nr:DUF4445 domain-containing protein [Desulfofustis sp.]